MAKRVLLIVLLVVAVAYGIMMAWSARRAQHGSSVPAPQTAADINDIFRAYQEKLPEPQTLSEGNGISLSCPRHGYATYTLLHGAADRMPVNGDHDLLKLIPWCRNDDPCLRQIALNCVTSGIEYRTGYLSVPCMHELDHFQYYDILVAAKAFLDSKHIKYDAGIFGDSLLDVSPEQFAATVGGMWAQDGSPKSYNFLDTLEIQAGTITVTTEITHPDPTWLGRTWRKTIKDVQVNEKRQFVLHGDWDGEPAGFDGGTQTTFPYNVRVWLVKKDVLWFRRSDREYWRKFTKTK